MKSARGFSLVELLIAIGIMGILMAIATHNWSEWTRKAGIENQIKMLHADLMELRLQALYTKSPRSAVIDGTEFKTFLSADGSGTAIETKNFKYRVGTAAVTVSFNSQGLSGAAESCLCVLPTGDTAVINQAAVDSIVVSQARINLGKRRTGDCTSDNIDQK